MNKKQLSKEGELRFASEFISKGWFVFLPYGEDSPIDLLIQKEEKFMRIQVKSTVKKNGVIYGRLKSSNNWQVKKYNGKQIDFFAIYEKETKKGYLIPIEEVEGKTSMILRLDPTKNNQKSLVKEAKNYEYF